MKVLALELSTARGSVAWKDDDHEVEKDWPNDRKNSGAFFGGLRDLLKTKGHPEMIVVGVGPGSYAGVRIAISAAIGLEAASGARLVGIPSICAMQAKESEYWAVGDARRQTFFLARIKSGTLMREPELLSEADLQGRLKNEPLRPIFSSDHLPQFDNVRFAYPSAARLARLAADENHDSFLLPPLQPMYLREPHITYPKISPRLSRS